MPFSCHQKVTLEAYLFLTTLFFDTVYGRDAKQPPGMVLKPCKSWVFNYQPQLVKAGFLPPSTAPLRICEFSIQKFLDLHPSLQLLPKG